VIGEVIIIPHRAGNRVSRPRRSRDGELNNLLPQDSIAIPENGYLVICRKTEINLNIGERVNLDSVTLPGDFANYPRF